MKNKTGKERGRTIMTDKNCIFCRLAGGEIPTNAIYEDDRFKVILDMSPATRGHALILPKQHAANIYELSEETTGEAFKLAKRMGAVMSEKLACEGLNIVQNNGEIAGQTVFHFHIHLIPRYADDHQQIGWKPMESNQEELEAVKNLFAK